MYVFGITVFVLLGLSVGSFLNVLAYRLPREISLVKRKRSFCPQCKKQLAPKNLVPVFSYLFQKGKCQYCHKKISCQYPLVELLTAILFALIFIKNYEVLMTWEDSLLIFAQMVFVGLLILIFLIDLKEMLILDVVIFPALPIVFLLNFILSGFDFGFAFSMLVAGLAGYFFYWIQYKISKGKWVGAGDQNLALLLGIMLGGVGLFLCFLLAYVSGAMVAVILLLTKKKNFKSQLPMGAFLAPSALFILFFGADILQWYFDKFVF